MLPPPLGATRNLLARPPPRSRRAAYRGCIAAAAAAVSRHVGVGIKHGIKYGRTEHRRERSLLLCNQGLWIICRVRIGPHRHITAASHAAAAASLLLLLCPHPQGGRLFSLRWSARLCGRCRPLSLSHCWRSCHMQGCGRRCCCCVGPTPAAVAAAASPSLICCYWCRCCESTCATAAAAAAARDAERRCRCRCRRYRSHK